MSEHTFPRRKLMRLQGYDYSQEGAYFVTICVEHRLHLFGNIENESMLLNPAGDMIALWWEKISQKYADVELDHWVVMPNHFHAIVVICRDVSMPDRTALSDVIRWFKTMTTTAYIRGVRAEQWEPFVGSLWQRNYYDHIVRDDADLQRIREYIEYNPARWHADTLYGP
jgi:REP element-mobilizing transposase RayT